MAKANIEGGIHWGQLSYNATCFQAFDSILGTSAAELKTWQMPAVQQRRDVHYFAAMNVIVRLYRRHSKGERVQAIRNGSSNILQERL